MKHELQYSIKLQADISRWNNIQLIIMFQLQH